MCLVGWFEKIVEVVERQLVRVEKVYISFVVTFAICKRV